MNILLEQKMLSSGLDEHDISEIKEIYEILNPEKKRNFLFNIDTIIESIKKLKQDLIDTQTLLLETTIKKIEDRISLTHIT